jgi:hypothetical protein
MKKSFTQIILQTQLFWFIPLSTEVYLPVVRLLGDFIYNEFFKVIPS